MVHLGFEVGSGEAVEIPLLNLAVTGQTQRSGKTTTLEALVRRSGVRALTFVTKRGESAFADARRIQPYFRDRADWQFVTSIIDATLQEKNKFLRPWIMKICRTTRTLADVQDAVRLALKTAKGLNEGVYTQLDAYLDLIVPEIRRTPLAPRLELGPGLNVMDVSGSPTPMQMLFIQSAIDWVNENESNTIVVIPEAWEFVPEGKSSPVKASATTLVRKGSGIGNHVWLDSQDMAGVDKVLLRGCPVWLIGVQREANEIKRNLSNIPNSIKKPKPEAVATLERGQFYACWGGHSIKTYVQPIWMLPHEAEEIALGGVQKTFRVTESPAITASPATVRQPEEPTVTEQEAQRLREENADLKRQVASLTHQIDKLATATPAREAAPPRAPASTNGHKAPVGSAVDLDIDYIYSIVRDRLAAEAPGIIKLMTIRPELEVQVERRTLTQSEDTLQGRLARLIGEGFFKDPQKADRARDELARRGVSGARPTFYKELDKLTTLGFLTKEADGYRAVADMKVRIVEA
jgi:hypothetical protein